MQTDQPKHGGTDLPSDLAKPAQRALVQAGDTHLEQLAKRTVPELPRLHGMGPKAIAQLRHALDAKGMSFAERDTCLPAV